MTGSSPFRSILVLVDGTESAMRASECAIRLAGAMSARLTAIAVVDTHTLRRLMSVRILVEPEVQEFEAGLQQTQQRYLDYVAQLAAKEQVAMETVLGRGEWHLTVLAEQKTRQADLIVLGGFRMTLTRLNLLARERQLIIDEAPCPVLVVK